MSKTTRRLIAAALFAGWLVSLALPAVGFRLDSDGKPTEGIVVLIGGWFLLPGWLGHLSYPAHLGWLANIAFLLVLLSMIGSEKMLHGRILLIATLALTLFSVVTLDLLLRPQAGPYHVHLQSLPGPSSDYSANGLGPGYYVWMATNLLAAIAAAIMRKMASVDASGEGRA